MSAPVRSRGRSLALQRRRRLLALLADGTAHSGEQLAKRLRISRGGIWKLVRALRALGIDLESLPRQGYRLARAVDLLEPEAITAAMAPATRERLDELEVLLNVDSTNHYLAEKPPLAPGRTRVCLAEVQNAGRGRRGRSWLAPFGSGICMSLSWQFAEAPPTFSALSLAVGVAAATALRRLGVQDVGLKWPNDLVWQHRKLGGILIEMRGESAGPAQVVIGLGLNMHMPAGIRLALAEQQAALIADIHEIMHERTPSRNAVVAALLDEMAGMLSAFAELGFEPFAAQWRELDTLANANVKVISGSETAFGRACGVDLDGTLLVDIDGRVRRFVSGEVSLRRNEPWNAEAGPRR